MPLPSALSRGLSFGKSKESKSEASKAKPPLQRPQASASALQRSLHKSTFLWGRQPPRANSPLTPEQILDLTFMLAQPVNTPLLTTSIARLKPPLTRPGKSTPATCLCDVHTWFGLRWIDELMTIIGKEIGPRLENLRNAPPQLRSIETDEILGMLQNYAHIFPADDPDGSRMANPFQCSIGDCQVCNLTSCRACKLSQFFQNEDAVKALSICAKGRKKRSRPWPEACAWLDPDPGSGWEMKWKKEGLPILSDRIIIRQWRKAGGEGRLIATMASIQAEVMADKEAIEKQLERATRHSMKSELTTDQNVYDDIVDRKWTVHEEAMRSTETIDLLRKMGMDDDEGDEQVRESKANSYEAAYHSLVGTKSRDFSRPSIHREETEQKIDRTSKAPTMVSTLSSALADTVLINEQSQARRRYLSPYMEPEEQVGRTSRASAAPSRNTVGRSSRASTVTSRNSVTSDTTMTSRSTRTSRSISVVQSPYDLDAEALATSYSNLLGTMPQAQSKLSLCADDGQEQVGNEDRARKRSTSYARLPARSRAQSRFSVDSWAIFNNSPLGRARQTQIMEPVDEGGSERRASYRSTSQGMHSSPSNYF